MQCCAAKKSRCRSVAGRWLHNSKLNALVILTLAHDALGRLKDFTSYRLLLSQGGGFPPRNPRGTWAAHREALTPRTLHAKTKKRNP